MSETAKIIEEMLKENTGSHFLDSGGYYGRNWQRNQTRDFNLEPRYKFQIETYKHDDKTQWYMNYSLSTYHWLLEQLTYEPKIDAQLQSIIDNSNNYYGEDIAEFFEVIEGMDLGFRKGFSENSYNYESLLDQVIQYETFELDDGYYVVLQIHGGCDVRGGYSRPRIFSLNNEYLFDQDGSIYCSECDFYWDTYDGGNNWEYDNDNSLRSSNIEIIEDEKDWIKGKLFVKEDGKAICPCCGKGELN